MAKRAGQQRQRGFERIFNDAAFGKGGAAVTATDVAVVVCALALAALAWVALASGWGRPVEPAVDAGAPVGASADVSGGLVAVVLNTDGYRAELPMDEDTVLVVEGSHGSNTIEIADGRVRCGEADCSNQVCVNTGWVSRDGEMVVCLPHELTVQVVSDPAKAVPLI